MDAAVVIDLAERLLGLRPPTMAAVAAVLASELVQVPDANEHIRVYKPRQVPPPFSRCDLTTPGPTSRFAWWSLFLEHHPDTGIAEADLVAHFGVVPPGQIIPNAAPEGLVYGDYDREGTRLSLGYSYRSRRLRNLVVGWRIEATSPSVP